MPALRTGGHPAVRHGLLGAQPGWEGRADYERGGGYQPGLSGADLITAVAASGLRGRGGAAFPVARKLATVAAQAGEKIVLVNGEEGEPASVKDRWLLRARPHLVIDGALRAAEAVGARTACLYVSDPASAASLESAIAELGPLKLWGMPAWWLWGLVHVTFLVGARNRFAVMFDWAWAYLTYRRSIRLITGAEAEVVVSRNRADSA